MSEYLTLAALQLDDPHANRPAAVAGFAAAGPVNAGGPLAASVSPHDVLALWVGLGAAALATFLAVLLSLLGG